MKGLLWNLREMGEEEDGNKGFGLVLSFGSVSFSGLQLKSDLTHLIG